MYILEYIVYFTFRNQNPLLFADNFKLDGEWEVLRINNIKNVEKSYCNKKPFNQPKENFDIALFRKTRWYYLDFKKCTGFVVKFSNDPIKIPNLEIISQNSEPYVVCEIFNFDLQILLTLVNSMPNVEIIEKKINERKCVIIHENLIIECSTSFLKYKYKEQEKFRSFVSELKELYDEYDDVIGKLYNIVGIEKKYLSHESLAPKTWYKARRENQQKWPEISTEPVGLEFPKNSGIYYPQKNVGLSKRSDDNNETYIPKLYKTNHSKNDKSFLFQYLNEDNDFKKTEILSNEDLENSIEIDFNGDILCIPKNPLFISRNKKLVGINKQYYEIPKNIKGQILGKNNHREYIITKENEIISNPGFKIKNMLTLPWYYKQIIHDYNKLGRLEFGDICDMSNIGVVDPDSTETITYPVFSKDLYVGQCLETHRLMTFKHQNDVKINIFN